MYGADADLSAFAAVARGFGLPSAASTVSAGFGAMSAATPGIERASVDTSTAIATDADALGVTDGTTALCNDR